MNGNNLKSDAVWLRSSGIRGRIRFHTTPSKNDPCFKSLKVHFDIMMHLGEVQVTGVVAMLGAKRFEQAEGWRGD